MRVDDICVITAYFNPAGYRRRLDNYMRFRAALDAPLIVAEMSHDGRFEVPEDEQTIVIRLSGADSMWQKESLLNVALDRVPAATPYVAWLDCDVLIERPDWKAEACEALARTPLVQLFTDLHDLPPSGETKPLPPRTGQSIAGLYADRLEPDTAFRPSETIHMRSSAFGLAWAARASILRRHRFYDAMIVGSGDRALACAALGRWEDASRSLKLSPPRVTHYQTWAKPFHDEVRGQVGVLPGPLLHLWHGDILDRRYSERHVRFAELPFDPALDLVRDKSGLWKWRRPREDIVRFMADYFAARREDGRVAP